MAPETNSGPLALFQGKLHFKFYKDWCALSAVRVIFGEEMQKFKDFHIAYHF